jgi:sulfoxide reductase heme-binding subunit YedZ
MVLKNKEKNIPKWLFHFLGLIPAGVLIIKSLTNNITANPIQALTQWTGRYAVIFLLASLLFSPLSRLTGNPSIKQYRKPFGLYAAFYAFIHFLIFIGLDYGFRLTLIFPVLSQKTYLLVGLAALLILALLSATSLKIMIEKLGKKWKNLHRLVYLSAILALLHYFLAIKTNPVYPIIASIVLAILLLLRIIPLKKSSDL